MMQCGQQSAASFEPKKTWLAMIPLGPPSPGGRGLYKVAIKKP
jgi:hypothetical protein